MIFFKSSTNVAVSFVALILTLISGSSSRCCCCCDAFVPTTRAHSPSIKTTSSPQQLLSSPISPLHKRQDQEQRLSSYHHPCVRNQRRSVSSVQTLGLFGLGTAEIVIIVVVGVFLLGPDQVSSTLGKLVGQLRGELDDLPDELKKIPKEFQKGLEEGETNARARNAKLMPKQEQKKDDD
jgi:Sec-independent protein translocase protein TatA